MKNARRSKFICFLFLLIFSTSCQKSKQNLVREENIQIEKQDSCDCEISYISALYYNRIFDTARAKNWDDLKLKIPSFQYGDYRGVLDATITDCNTLKEIDKELKTLKVKDYEGDADIRIVLYVHYKDKETLFLSVGGYFASDFVTKDRMALESKNTNRLLFLLKNNIGYYPWIDKDDFNYMDELKDTTFAREPFIESPYYKQYKEIRSKK